MFANEMVLINEARKQINDKPELWRKAFESNQSKISKSKMSIQSTNLVDLRIKKISWLK